MEGAMMDFSKVNYKKSDDGFAICFGEKEIKTPVRNTLCAPCEKMAVAITKEWHSLTDKVDWTKLPMSSHLGAVLDSAECLEEWKEDIVSFASSDLLCYLATGPKELKEQQEQKWLPLIERVNKDLGINLQITYGISPIKQPQETLDTIAKALEKYDLYEIFIMRSWITYLNSFVLVYALLNEWISTEEAFEMHLIDEEWQEHHWGKDKDVIKVRDNVYKEFMHCYNFYTLLK